MVSNEDRELLELAAKAAGLKWVEPTPDGMPWNPLTDDGDALRLAVSLKIHHRQYSNQVQIRGSWYRDGYVEAVRRDVEEREPINGDQYRATRRAIVRAAATIGRNIK